MSPLFGETICAFDGLEKCCLSDSFSYNAYGQGAELRHRDLNCRHFVYDALQLGDHVMKLDLLAT